MSDYRHDLKKCGDRGLQLRLPVDLVPANEWGEFTNALPVIEGQLIARDGLTLVGSPITTSFINTFQVGVFHFQAIGATTIYPHGLFVGEVVVINVIANDPTQAATTTLGSYTVTVQTVPSSTSFTFTPSIATTEGSLFINYPTFAQVVAPTVLGATAFSPITALFRLNEAIQTLPGDRLAAIGPRLYHAPLPAGNAFEELVGPIAPNGGSPTQVTGFSGRPLTIISFRFTLDTATWALIADDLQMYKYRPGLSDSQIEFAPLGNAPPTVAATASAGGVGNLNSSGGTGYDWRYTYVDGYAMTESNGSPIDMSSGGTSTVRPTAFVNPAVGGDVAFTAPGNAIDTSLTTFATGTTSASQTGTGVTISNVDCIWNAVGAASGTVTAISLNVLANLSVDAQHDSGGGASSNAKYSILYSYDGGTTYQTLTSINVIGTPAGASATTGQQTFTTVIPSAVSLTSINVKIIGTATARGSTDHMGNAYSAFAQVTGLIYDINLSVTQSGSTLTLSLTNQSANVCVAPSPFPQHKFINLYRRGGSLPDAWRFVSQSQASTLVRGSCGVGLVTINDNVSDTQLSTQPILLLDNNQPVQSVTVTNQPLGFIWGPVGIDARVLGCGDPARPESVYFSKPGNPDSWPPQNFLEVSDPGTPIIAGTAFNTRNFAFSQEAIYELVEGLGTGTTYTPFRTPSNHGLFTRYGLTTGPGGMYFIAKDGIYVTAGGVEQSIVTESIQPLFPTYDTPGQQVATYEAVDYSQPDKMDLRYHNDELYFDYAGAQTGVRQTLVYDIVGKRWRGLDVTAGLSEVYSELATTSSLLYGTVSGSVWQAGGASDPPDLDIIENATVTTFTGATTFPSGTEYVRLIRYNSFGAVAASYQFAVTVGATTGIQVVIPPGPSDTTFWNVWYDAISGPLTRFTQFLESSLPTNRVVQISTQGSAGTMPTVSADTTIDVVVRTGAHDQSVPLNQKQYGNVIFDLDPGGATNAAPVIITPFVNGAIASQAAITVTGTGRQQVSLNLSDFFAYNTEYEIKWSRTTVGAPGATITTNPIIYQYDTLHFLEPVSVTHWQSQPTSFEYPGFVHVRDAYIAIRSTVAVNLIMHIDGANFATYSVPSTSGQKKKVYIPFDSNKGLVYRWSLDSSDGTTQFRVYEADIEFRVKPWLGVLGYQIQRVLGGETEA
jgi:hypothetical protein